jgi:uncharacterized repeat protein (TIGR03837 family)
MQRSVEQDAGKVACERPAGTIGTVHPRCQTDDQQPSLRIPEREHGSGVIGRMAIPNLRQKRGQPAAGRAGKKGFAWVSRHWDRILAFASLDVQPSNDCRLQTDLGHFLQGRGQLRRCRRLLALCQGVNVRLWPPSTLAATPADVVIEAFACELPPEYIAAMAERACPPVWINLEYLSAEVWVGECHLLPSPHPRLPLTKHFFFPGFTTDTGGLLRERDLLERRSAFTADPASAWAAIGVPPPATDEVSISLFCYENAALPHLMAEWTRSATPIRCLVRSGRCLDQIAGIVGKPDLGPGKPWRQGPLSVYALPFCAQHEFDHLLWACDLNFVRGEDSFVRAQWAGRPFVWQIYPQQDDAHRRKLEAFLDRYCADLPAAATMSCRRFWQIFNEGADAPWEDFWQQRKVLAGHAVRWTDQLARHRDLAKNLADFVESRLK